MLDPEQLEAWLKSANDRYRREEMPPRGRPFQAMSDYTREFKCSVAFDSPLAKSVFDWFHANSQPGSHAVGALFTGAFYFDACFWPLYIPLGYGMFSLNALECLGTMPLPLKQQIEQSRQDLWHLAIYWADCCDYAYGIDDVRKQEKLNPKALSFIENADRELIGAIAQLNSARPNSKAILALRMATEIFLKALLIQEKNLTDQQLKKLSHRIEDIAEECFVATRVQEFRAIAKAASIFPDVSDRYTGDERKLSEVWRAVCVAQAAATTVTRRYTDRDMRPQIYGPREGTGQQ
jgi:hypothetical protein